MKKIAAVLCCLPIALSMSAASLTVNADQTEDSRAGVTVDAESSGETLESGGFTFDLYSYKATASISGFNQKFYAARVNPDYETNHTLIFPSEVEGGDGTKYQVTSIDIGGLYSAGWKDGKDANTFTKVIIPKSVEKINLTFTEMTNLEYVSFEEGSKLSSLDSIAFEDCTNLKRVGINGSDKLPDLIRIGSYAFKNCKSLKSIEIPAGVRYIQSETFYGDESLETVVFQTYKDGENAGKSNLWQIGYSAFEGCSSLKNIELPVSTNSNGYAILSSCFKDTALTGINIPECVKSVGEEAFAGTKLDQNGLTVLDGKSKGESYGIAFFGKTTKIDENAFGDVKPTVAGYDNSNADTFAFNHDLKFVSLGDWNPYVFPVIGDIDGDKEITSYDAITVLRMSIGADEYNDDMIKIIDVDEDGEITANDAIIILRASIGL